MLAEIENGIVTLLKSGGITVRDVDLFGSDGTKTRNEAAKRSKLPAAFVAIESGSFETVSEGTTYRWRPAILVAVAFKDWSNDRSRRHGAVAIVENVVTLISGRDLGLDIGPIKPERVFNITDADLLDKGICVWQIVFSTWFDTEFVDDPSTLDDLLTVVAEWDMDPESDGEPTPVDTIELEGGS